MQIEKLEDNWYLVRIEPEERFMDSLAKIMRDGKFGFAWFWSIGGGFKGIDCSFLVDHEKNPIKKFKGPVEFSNANGSISWDDEKSDSPIVHCYVDLSDSPIVHHSSAYLSEVKVIELAAELLLKTFDKKITCQLDKRVNLKLLDLPSYSTQQEFSHQNNSNNSPLGLAILLGIIIFGLLAAIMFWAVQKSKKTK